VTPRLSKFAGVVELVDAPDSKSGARDGVRVRVPPPAPRERVAATAAGFPRVRKRTYREVTDKPTSLSAPDNHVISMTA
jgi:hypothetical protein